MCIDCWNDHGSPAIWNEDVRKAVELIREIYRNDEMGNPLHVVLDDWNIEQDEFIEVYEGAGAESIPAAAVQAAKSLAPVFLELTVEERASALAYAHGFLAIPEPCS